MASKGTHYEEEHIICILKEIEAGTSMGTLSILLLHESKTSDEQHDNLQSQRQG